MSLASALADLAGQAGGPGILVAVDFDGVLAPLRDDPAESRPLPEAAQALRRLARASGTHLAVVSGRALADLAWVADPPPGTHLVGSHGAERGRWTDGKLGRSELALGPREAALLDELTAGLQALVAGTTGRAERKPTSVVLHTRTATADDAARLVPAALSLGRRPGVDLLQGKDVVELSVLAVTKGDALVALRAELGVGAVLYAGDDVTDERAFAALRPGDLTVKVGAGPTLARWRVDGPAEVAALLSRLADLVT